MSARDSSALKSASKVLDVLNVLMGHFTHGLTLSQLSKATGNPMPTVSRYVDALESKGMAERIPETGRIRPSIRFAQLAVGILSDVERAKNRLDEIQARLSTKL
ncbi:MAG: helix-turn-helix domain-containing protein [Pseudomonadota bacterium]